MEYHKDAGLLNICHFGAKTKVYETIIRWLLYADDCALFAHSEEELRHVATAFATASRKFGLRVAVPKTTFFQPAPGVSSLPSLNIMIDS